MKVSSAILVSLVLVAGSVLHAEELLDEAKALEQIQLRGGPKLKISRVRPLTWINFHENTIDDEHIYLLRSIKSLRQVILFGNLITDKGLRELKGTTVSTLDIRSHKITGEGLKALSELENLEHLNLFETTLPAEELKNLVHLKKLKLLNVAYSKEFTDESIGAITEMQHLTGLTLGFTSVTNAGMREVAKFKNLKGLNLHSCQQITSECSESLAELKTLESIVLSQSGIDDQVIDGLVNLKRLKVLYLEGCSGITDASAPKLVKIESLTKLVLRQTGITDAGLKQLYELKNLKELNVVGTAVTDEGLEAFKKARPNVKVNQQDSNGANTGG